MTFTCPHFSVSNVAAASCATCGPLKPAPVVSGSGFAIQPPKQ